MKFCPYCGATIIGGAAPFCAECGKALPRSAKPQPPSHKPKPSVAIPNPSKKQKQRRPPLPAPQQKRGKSRPDPKKNSQKPRNPNLHDEGYDGYYDDIMPIDNGHTRDRMDPELTKRIIIISAVAGLIVILAVVLMYLL